MPTAFGSLRRFVLTPSLRKVTFAERGFPGADATATAHLEAIPQAVICGFEWGIDARDRWEVERRLQLVAAEHRGFAYEGATMAFTILDAMGGRGRRTRELLLGGGERHIFLSYIGIGFAMTRLPRRLWSRVLPDLPGSPYHPTMSWLAVDGYGFDLAYFHTRRWVDEQRVPEPYPWLGAPEYFPRAVDQGIGRALWFIHRAQPAAVASAVARFARHRQADLWSGVGLAAAFAGGCEPEGLATLRAEAGPCLPHLAQGAVFAAKARSYAGHVPSYSATTVTALTALSMDEAVELADDTAEPHRAGLPDDEPAYELWRRNIRGRFTADGDRIGA
ncbi:enediyne biosynthesis protein [Actinomadura sp. CNU-125]|uniref:DUF1702 family protein n=1 Tax=Actinomadura sp. CNU-125 TaxID=1904961 RepID=UPI00095B184D|nr:DUF1702 family protein [Actinomadura sp. CNU-125]OLT19098.1 enediyne biosynthesis protein [Actinomadura sp. CNU-125]